MYKHYNIKLEFNYFKISIILSLLLTFLWVVFNTGIYKSYLNNLDLNSKPKTESDQKNTRSILYSIAVSFLIIIAHIVLLPLFYYLVDKSGGAQVIENTSAGQAFIKSGFGQLVDDLYKKVFGR